MLPQLFHRSYVVAPTDSRLAHAEDEAERVIEVFAGERVVPASIGRLSAARHTLRGGFPRRSSLRAPAGRKPRRRG